MATPYSAVLDRDEMKAQQLVNEINQQQQKAFFVLTDLTQHDSCKNAVDQIFVKYGHIDGLVNNAGINDGISLESGNYENFIRSLNDNVGHYYEMESLVVDSLKESSGTIVNICSKVAETGQGGTSGYAAANGIRSALTTEWATQLLPFGVRANAVVVAECWTPQYEKWIYSQPNGQEKLNEIISKIPFDNRMTTPDEIAHMVLFLLSPLSNSINGQFLYVDVGYVHLDRKIQGEL